MDIVPVAPLDLAEYDVADIDDHFLYGPYEACFAVKDERLEGAAAARVLDRVALDESPVHYCVPFVDHIGP